LDGGCGEGVVETLLLVGEERGVALDLEPGGADPCGGAFDGLGPGVAAERLDRVGQSISRFPVRWSGSKVSCRTANGRLS
jgi:hypothetical protein